MIHIICHKVFLLFGSCQRGQMCSAQNGFRFCQRYMKLLLKIIKSDISPVYFPMLSYFISWLEKKKSGTLRVSLKNFDIFHVHDGKHFRFQTSTKKYWFYYKFWSSNQSWRWFRWSHHQKTEALNLYSYHQNLKKLFMNRMLFIVIFYVMFCVFHYIVNIFMLTLIILFVLIFKLITFCCWKRSFKCHSDIFLKCARK